MKIAVLDVAAERGGALSVLHAAHAAAVRAPAHEWVFVVSKPELAKSAHVRVRRYPWIKRSWPHRLWFEYVVAPKILKEEKADIVVSLQNVAVARVCQPQTIYLHTALPFSPYRFSLRKNPKLWLYQKLVTRRILGSLEIAARIIVQASWMKTTVANTAGIDPDRISVIRPTIASLGAQEQYGPTHQNRRRFFYPAEALPYKNHWLIFAAATKLERSGIDIDILCTISPESLESLGIPRVPDNVRLAGRMPYEDVQHEYESRVLLFPSLLETVGLPLMEAQSRQTFVLAADLPYAHDVLAGYDNAHYFDPEDPNDLASLMTSVVDGSVRYSNIPAPRALETDPWDEFVRVVTSP